MVSIYLSYYKYKKKPHCVNGVVKYFSDDITNYIKHYDTEIGRNQRIIARILLYRILKSIYGSNKSKILISKICKDISGKDIIPESPTIDFSYSYSHGIVICALAVNSKVGIDIEEIKSFDINEYNQVLCNEELLQIRSSPNPVVKFLNIWTQKEAILKMQGTGLLVDDLKIQNIILENTGNISTFTNNGYVYTISINDINKPIFKWI